MPPDDYFSSDQTRVTDFICRYRNAWDSPCDRKAIANQLFELLYRQTLRFARLSSRQSENDVEQVALDSIVRIFGYFETSTHAFEADRRVFALLNRITTNSKNEMVRK
jgi:hypothetical protein